MSITSHGPHQAGKDDGSDEIVAENQRKQALLTAEALQDAIFHSANFSSIATDARGVIQLFNVGAERMLGYSAVEVLNTITPAELSDPRELVARARTLNLYLLSAYHRFRADTARRRMVCASRPIRSSWMSTASSGRSARCSVAVPLSLLLHPD